MPKLYDLAHCRAGDKGNTSILSLIAYRAEDYPLLVEQRDGRRGRAPPARHRAAARSAATSCRNLHALQFVCERSLARRRDDVARARRAREVAVVRAARDGGVGGRLESRLESSLSHETRHLERQLAERTPATPARLARSEHARRRLPAGNEARGCEVPANRHRGRRLQGSRRSASARTTASRSSSARGSSRRT